MGLHIPGVGLLNFALVWCLPFTLDLLYAEGRFHGHQALAAALVAFGTNVALVALGPYELSLVTVSGQRLSNMSPPTVVLALHAVVVCGLAAAARGPLTVLLTRPRVWWAVTVTNLSAMTIYLWHLPVLIAGLGAAGALGWNRPGPGEPHFWLASFALLAVFLLATATTVRLLWPTEHAALPWWDAPVGERPGRPAPPALVALAGSAVGVGTLLLAKDGLAGLTRNGAMTWPALAVVAGGLVACRAPHAPRATRRACGRAGGGRARHAAGARAGGCPAVINAAVAAVCGERNRGEYGVDLQGTRRGPLGATSHPRRDRTPAGRISACPGQSCSPPALSASWPPTRNAGDPRRTGSARGIRTQRRWRSKRHLRLPRRWSVARTTSARLPGPGAPRGGRHRGSGRARSSH